MTKTLLLYLIKWIEYMYDTSVIIVDSKGRLFINSHYGFLSIFSPLEQLVVRDFIFHLKNGNKNIIHLENDKMYVCTSDINELIQLIERNANASRIV